jgi:integrase
LAPAFDRVDSASEEQQRATPATIRFSAFSRSPSLIGSAFDSSKSLSLFRPQVASALDNHVERKQFASTSRSPQNHFRTPFTTESPNPGDNKRAGHFEICAGDECLSATTDGSVVALSLSKEFQRLSWLSSRCDRLEELLRAENRGAYRRSESHANKNRRPEERPTQRGDNVGERRPKRATNDDFCKSSARIAEQGHKIPADNLLMRTSQTNDARNKTDEVSQKSVNEVESSRNGPQVVAIMGGKEREDPASARLIYGGDLDNQVSNEEIDFFTEYYLGRRAFSARAFYDWQDSRHHDGTTDEALRRKIDEKLTIYEWIFMPVWTRHHWATAIIQRAASGFVIVTVYDSAAHPITAKDYNRAFRALGFDDERIATIQHAKQKPRSNECGLHPIILACLFEGSSPAPLLRQTTEVLDLGRWRATLKDHFQRGSYPKRREILQLIQQQKHPLALSFIDMDEPVVGGGNTALQTVVEVLPNPLVQKAKKKPRDDEVITIEDDADEEVEREIDEATIMWDDITRGKLDGSHEIRRWFHHRQEEIRVTTKENALRPLSEVGVVLRLAPDAIVSNEKTMSALRGIVAVKAAREKAKTEADHHKDIFRGRLESEFIDTTIIREVIDAMPPSNVTIIQSQEFLSFQNTGSLNGIPNKFHEKVAFIFLINGHYILLRIHNGKTEVLDSLNPHAAWFNDSYRTAIGRALHLLQMRGIKASSTVNVVQCRRQASNECAIETINNLCEWVFGHRGNLSRGLIGEAYKLRNQADRRNVWSKVWKKTGENQKSRNSSFPRCMLCNNSVKSGNRCRECNRDVHVECMAKDGRCALCSLPELEPRAAKTASAKSAEHVPRKTCLKSGDKNEKKSLKCKICHRHLKIADGWCGWCHPMICSRSDGSKCSATAKGGKRCSKLAICVIPGVRVCQDHLSEEQRAHLIHFLENHREPCCNEKEERSATKPRLSADQGKCLSNKAISELLATIQVGDGVKWSAVSETGEHQCTIAKLERRASATIPAKLLPIANKCTICRQWHPNDEGSTILPCKEMHILAIEPYSDVVETCEPCYDEDAGSDDEEEGESAVDSEKLREPERFLNSYPNSMCRAGNARNWFIYTDKPPGMHNAVWANRTPATRKLHARWLERLKTADSSLQNVPIPIAVVEIVLRLAKQRKWRWSTISSSLATFATALSDLPLYTSEREGINIRVDPYFRAAAQTANREAKKQALRPLKADPISLSQFKSLAKKLSQSNAWFLLQLSWYLAARVGDVRRLRPKHIFIEETVDKQNTVAVKATFVEGKGVYFSGGPYTIHTRLPYEVAKPIAEWLRTNQMATICSLNDQRILAKAIGSSFSNCSLRSIRKGSLIHYSRCGANENNLMQLSGHKRKETLLRYLGWGLFNSEADRAATTRAELEASASGSGPSTATKNSTIVAGDMKAPMKMGWLSGFNGRSGRRIKKAPELFSQSAPNREELGLEIGAVDTSDWKLHVYEDLTTINEGALDNFVEDSELAKNLEMAREFLRDPSLLNPTDASELSEEQLPCASFKPDQWSKLLSGKDPKLVPIRSRREFSEGEKQSATKVSNPGIRVLSADTKLMSGVRGFTVPQPKKKRWRPIFETLYNKSIAREKLPKLSYPPRRVRRSQLAKAKYLIQFDFRGWYDQIKLHDEVLPYHIVRSKVPIEVNGEFHTLFALTREPMGSAHSAHVAQTITWAILEPILNMKKVLVHTMIDNVAIGSDDKTAFVKAVRLFVARCKKIGATINDMEGFPSTDDGIIELGEKRPFTFLGEVYEKGGRVRNSEQNVQNLRDAFTRIQSAANDPNIAVTKRQVCSIISLWTWLANTIELKLCDHFDMIRLFSQTAKLNVGWDDAIRVNGFVVNTIQKAIEPTLRNVPVSPKRDEVPSKHINDYGACIIVDSSGSGWGAWCKIGDEMFEIREGWLTPNLRSAHAEPMGAREAVRWVRERTKGNLAVVVDHSAMAYGQRRPHSGNGGFSTAFYLNSFFEELYSIPGNHQVFYVKGESNPADRASRANRIGEQRRVNKLVDIKFPPLSAFLHPFDLPSQRPWWNV